MSSSNNEGRRMSSQILKSPQNEPQQLIENRTSFAGKNAVFSIYDTYKKAEGVALHPSTPMYCGMISGKKIIHSDRDDSFEFKPNESLVLPPDKKIFIDFPEAEEHNPTKCITIELPDSKVNSVVQKMNETMPRHGDSGEWQYHPEESVHFSNIKAVDMLIEKLFYIFTKAKQQRDLLIDLNISELIVYMLQSESRKVLIKNYKEHVTSNRLSNAVAYIQDNLTEEISIEKVANVAYMSKSSFYRYFKNEFGMTPVEYINEKRVELACKLLRQKGTNVTNVCYKVGYSSLSHFIKLFKSQMGITPKQYQLQIN